MTIKEFEERAKQNGGYDREFGEWKIIDIHQIPELFLEQHEIDFWCRNQEKVYLLRLRNRENENYRIVADEKHLEYRYPPYLIAELPIHFVDNNFIKATLSKFDLV